MPNYANTKIYKVINLQDESKIYVGSTCNRLSQRMSLHRQQAKDQTDKLHADMREIGFEQFKIILIELFPCNSKDEKTAREQHWIDLLHSYYNTNRAYRTDEQKKQYYKQYNKQYQQTMQMNLSNTTNNTTNNTNKHTQKRLSNEISNINKHMQTRSSNKESNIIKHMQTRSSNKVRNIIRCTN